MTHEYSFSPHARYPVLTAHVRYDHSHSGHIVSSLHTHTFPHFAYFRKLNPTAGGVACPKYSQGSQDKLGVQ